MFACVCDLVVWILVCCAFWFGGWRVCVGFIVLVGLRFCYRLVCGWVLGFGCWLLLGYCGVGLPLCWLRVVVGLLTDLGARHV